MARRKKVVEEPTVSDQSTVDVEANVKRGTEMSIHIGSEPSFKGKLDVSNYEIGRALSWYSLNKEREDSCNWFIRKFPDVSKDAINIIGNAGFLVRMVDRGLPYDETVSGHIMARYKEALDFTNNQKEKPKEKTKEKDTVVIPVRDTVLDGYLEMVDTATDAVIKTGKGIDVAFGDMTATQRKAVVAYVKDRIKEVESEMDEEECGYKGIREMNALVKTLNNILVTIDKTVPTKQRKVRAKKPVMPEKLVRKFKDVKLADGIKLTKMIGAKGALVFDEARRKIMFFEGTAEGLSIKGASIINIASTSMSKTLRNPDEQLPTLVGQPFRTTQKLVSDIKSVSKAPRPRGNENWTILAIF